MRILLMCVGVQDPHPENKPGQDGPILSFMDYLSRIPRYQPYKPDRIYLLSTAKKPGASRPTQERGEQTVQELRERGWAEVYHRLLDVLDPTDYPELFPKMKEIALSILEEPGNEDAELWINVSPGTGQMEAVWLSLVNSGTLKARLLQVKAPWDEPDEEKRIREVDISPLFESDYIKIGCDLFTNFGFQRASEVLFDLGAKTVGRERTDNAELFSDLARCYAHWENFEYSKALEGMERLLRRESIFKDVRFKGLRELLEEQHKVLERLNQNDLFTTVVDLYQSARRQREAGNYVDCIWRCWGVYELLITEKAKEAIRKECKLPQEFPLPYRFRDFISKGRGQPEIESIIRRFGEPANLPKYLGRTAAEDFLSRTGSPLSEVIEKRREDIEWLAEKRHQALHETIPPDEGDAQKALRIAQNILNEAFAQPDEVARYPFSPGKVKRVAGWMAQLI